MLSCRPGIHLKTSLTANGPALREGAGADCHFLFGRPGRTDDHCVLRPSVLSRLFVVETRLTGLPVYESVLRIATALKQDHSDSRRIPGLERKLLRQQEHVAFYQRHVTDKTFPPVVFGTRQDHRKPAPGAVSLRNPAR